MADIGIVQQIFKWRGRCFACKNRFGKHDVPRHVRMTSGVTEKFCRSCDKKMGRPGSGQNINSRKPKTLAKKPRHQPKKSTGQFYDDWPF